MPVLGALGMSYSKFIDAMVSINKYAAGSWLRVEQSWPFRNIPLSAAIEIEPSALIGSADVDVPLAFVMEIKPGPVRNLLINKPKFASRHGLLQLKNVPLADTSSEAHQSWES